MCSFLTWQAEVAREQVMALREGFPRDSSPRGVLTRSIMHPRIASNHEELTVPLTFADVTSQNVSRSVSEDVDIYLSRR